MKTRYEIWIGTSFQSVAWTKKQKEDKQKEYDKRNIKIEIHTIKY